MGYEGLKIDMHTHILPEKLPNYSKKFGYEGFINLIHHKAGKARMIQGDRFFREISSNCWDPVQRIEEYRQFNTQYQVICTVPVMFSYWAKPSDTLELSKYLNDHIASIVEEYPKNYMGLGTIPMQDVNLAIQELERIKELGLLGVQIGSNINNINLNDPQFHDFYGACEDLSVAILVHPWEMMGSKEIKKYWLPWLVGMPAETTRALCSMIFGGIFDKFPKLRVNFSHAGGSFFATLGRIEHGFKCRPDLVAVDNDVPPTDYKNKFWIDSITHDPSYLEFILSKVDSKTITLGSDYPFPLGDLSIGRGIETMNLSIKDKENIMYKSSLSWLGISNLDN